ncbi:helix-turn-helix domain-containing protein [Candidatus Woesearchaeota archaeon]|nr:helix-turn-helix domain-containing protein [Candidatus Woesearchaeota archaeon]
MDSVQGSSSEAMILRLIRSCANGISSKEVYEAVGLDRHTVAKHLATLEGLGLVSCRKIAAK